MAEFDAATQSKGSPKLSANSVTDRMVDAAVNAWVEAEPGQSMRAAIKAALREQPAPEPVAYRWKAVLDDARISNWVLTHSEPPPYAVAHEPLYAHPPQDKLREATQMALRALGRWDALIQHQFTGSSAAMTDMHRAAQATVPAVDALREALGESDA